MPSPTTEVSVNRLPSGRTMSTRMMSTWRGRPSVRRASAAVRLLWLTPIARASRLPVPAGRSAIGTPVSASTSATAHAVPSPPEAATMDAPSSRASLV